MPTSRVALLLLLVACQSTKQPPPDTRTSADDEMLVLDAADHTALRGTFRHGKTTIEFDMYKDSVVERVAITGANGRELVSQIQVGDMLGISVFGGAASTYMNLAIVRRSADLARNPAAPDLGAQLTADGALALVGDQNEFVRFEDQPEAATVAWLSRALGVRGYNGRDYPLTLRLHLLGSQLASRLELDVPSDGGAAARSGTGGTGPRAAGEQDRAYVDDDDSGGGGGGGGSTCQDLRGDPQGNNSYGMCGPGGSCWEWTCGDCCCHDGCKSHDWTCRNCHWYTPWNCILCGTFSSMIAGACGTSCQETTYAQPCTIGPYEQCNGYCTCTGTYDGSTEEDAAPVQWGCGQLVECDPALDAGCDPNTYCIPLPY